MASQDVGRWGSQVRIRLSLVGPQDTAGNRSQVRVEGLLYNGGTSGASDGSCTWSISGQASRSGSKAFSVASKATLVWVNETFWVDHDADGTKTVSFTFTLGNTVTQTFGSGGSVSLSWTLPAIPRRSASTITGGTTVDLGSTVTINTNRAVGTFTHTLQLWEYGVGAESPLQTIATGVGASQSWTPNASTLGAMFPEDTSKQFFIRTITFDGATDIGRHDLVITLQAPAGMVPVVTGVTPAEQNSTISSVVGRLVQGLSRVKFTVAATAVGGSPVASRQTTFQGQTTAQGTEILVTEPGNGRSVVGRATDQRGRQGTGNYTVDFLPYTDPVATAFQVRRSNSGGTLDEDGTYLRVDLTAAVASLVNSSERNAMTIRVFTREYGTTPWSARNVITSGLTYNSSFVITGGGWAAATKSWDVKVEIHDAVNPGGTHVKEWRVPTTAVAFDINGVFWGVGKYHERGALDVGPGGIYDDGKLVLNEDDLATNAETQAGSLTTKAVTPASLASRTATTSRTGIAEIATAAEVLTGTDDTRIITPARLAAHPVMLTGTTAQRAARTSKHMQLWQDTNGDQYLWVGNRSGGWRRYSGRGGVASAAWDYNQSSGSVTTVARSISLTIPTVLDTDEDLLITPIHTGTGFGFISVAGLVKNPSNTVATIRFMQIGAATQQALTVAWQLVKV